MTTIDEMFPRKYANGADLEGKPVEVVINRLQFEKMYSIWQQKDAFRWILYLNGGEYKGIILCKTLARQIAEALGSENSADWMGKQIVLFPQKLMVGGVQRIAIRARSTNGKPT